MSSIKAPMSSSYKAVFALSILMIFVVIIGGAMSGSKSVGFGIWYWGYTAWKMYKRDNDSLISLQKIMLWFEAIAFSIALVVLLFSDSDVRRYVDVTPIGLIIIATLTIGITYLLYKFFKGQKNTGLTSALIGGNSSIDDRFWEQASRELESDRHEATWARAMASAEGDDAKTKALYIKIRSADLQRINSTSVNEFSVSTEGIPNAVVAESKLFWSSFNGIGKLAILGVVVLVGYAIYDSVSSNTKPSSTFPNTSTSSSQSSASPSSSQTSTQPNNGKTIKSIEEVNSLCYVFWDGRRWQNGKTEGGKFQRLVIGRYGVEVIEAALPIEMAKEFGINGKSPNEIDIEKGAFGAFMKENWYQLDLLCKLR